MIQILNSRLPVDQMSFSLPFKESSISIALQLHSLSLSLSPSTLFEHSSISMLSDCILERERQGGRKELKGGECKK